ncbi:hypothetical protein L1887_51752 [Cichorium endivia]|nr:hypothetical protein L1887_51752 [Cichorium endivia]
MPESECTSPGVMSPRTDAEEGELSADALSAKLSDLAPTERVSKTTWTSLGTLPSSIVSPSRSSSLPEPSSRNKLDLSNEHRSSSTMIVSSPTEQRRYSTPFGILVHHPGSRHLALCQAVGFAIALGNAASLQIAIQPRRFQAQLGPPATTAIIMDIIGRHTLKFGNALFQDASFPRRPSPQATSPPPPRSLLYLYPLHPRCTRIAVRPNPHLCFPSLSQVASAGREPRVNHGTSRDYEGRKKTSERSLEHDRTKAEEKRQGMKQNACA